jgi:hypothetical protein
LLGTYLLDRKFIPATSVAPIGQNKELRMIRTRALLTVVVGVLAATSAWGQTITSATVNYSNNTLIIVGLAFGPTAQVTLGQGRTPLTVLRVNLAPPQTVIAAFPSTMPASGFAPGSYLLTVVFPGLSTATFEVAMGASESTVLTLQRQVTDLRSALAALQTSNSQLQAAVAALQTSNGQLQAAVAALQTNVGTLQAIDGKLQLQLDALRSNSVLTLNGKLNLSPDGTTALFNGINVQIVNGLGNTETVNGRGNLIVGYDEPNPGPNYLLEICSNGTYRDQPSCTANGGVWGANQRTGSHNLVIGHYHSYTQFGGMVAGLNNAINAGYANVSGGFANLASGVQSSVSGGSTNTASGGQSSISGGYANTASGQFSSVSGGISNTASGDISSVSGGNVNTASGAYSSVSGGGAMGISIVGGNTASGTGSSVSGGSNRSATSDHSWAAGALFQPN